MISWGISYYLIGGFGGLIASDLGWPQDIVYGGFSAALLAMGLVSPLTGQAVDHFGGRLVMVVGSLLTAIGCIGLAFSRSVPLYYGSWICLGIAMRLTLYDAAFAALARIGGSAARGPISQITLLGGLASSVFWPLGHFLTGQIGWRGAVLVYAGFAILTIPLHLTLPSGRHDGGVRAGTIVLSRPLADGRSERFVAGSLYALIAISTNFLNAGMSAHMIDILGGLGIAAATAAWIATLRGIGQSSARLGEVLFGRRIDALTLNLLATALLPICFCVGLFSGQAQVAALLFAFVYGAGNGIITITRGTLPLVLFDNRAYGGFVGKLLTPSFILSAAAPVIYAVIIDKFGDDAALMMSIGIGVLTFAAALVLKLRFAQHRNNLPSSGDHSTPFRRRTYRQHPRGWVRSICALACLGRSSRRRRRREIPCR